MDRITPRKESCRELFSRQLRTANQPLGYWSIQRGRPAWSAPVEQTHRHHQL